MPHANCSHPGERFTPPPRRLSNQESPSFSLQPNAPGALPSGRSQLSTFEAAACFRRGRRRNFVKPLTSVYKVCIMDHVQPGGYQAFEARRLV
jgi:hypothetical protein